MHESFFKGIAAPFLGVAQTYKMKSFFVYANYTDSMMTI